MKDFIRALRFSWPYRKRLAVSVVCAVLAAVLWSLNLTAIYPVLKILGNNESLGEWVDRCIREDSEMLDKLRAESDVLEEQDRKIKGMPEGHHRDKEQQRVVSKMATLETKIDRGQTQLWYFTQARFYVVRFLPTDRFNCLALLTAIVVVAVGIKGLFEFWQETLVGSVVNLSLYDLRRRFFRKAIQLDVANFTNETGAHDLMARFTNDSELLGVSMRTLFAKVVAEPLKAICCALVALWISWQLTLLFLVLVPISGFILFKVGRLMKRATRRQLERMSSIYKILQETFQAIRLVKAFTMEPYERRRFRMATKDYYHKSMLTTRIDAMSGPVIELLGALAVAVSLLAGAYIVLRHETFLSFLPVTEQPLDVEGLLLLYGLLAAIADPVRKLSSVFTRLQSGEAAANRVFTFMDRQPQVKANLHEARLPRHEQGIEFRDVCFSYMPGRPILTNIHFKVRRGETIALVGKNGCGKTTLLGLVPRFYDPDHGSILIDGQDIRDVQLRSLRQQIGLVSQDTMLFDDTIFNNIAYGNAQAKKEDVEAAAQRTFAHDFIMQQPNGYATRVGEIGGKLSGGQKQRLALARAVLRDPSILILDEFTSQIDSESEALIHRALHEFMRDRTTFIITHRLHTLEIADRIVVLDNTRLVAIGTHAELLHSCDVYQRLHDAHFLRQCA